MENKRTCDAAADAPKQEPVFKTGKTIGRWRIAGFIGRGGMAEVYEVEDAALGARYALKLFTYSHGEVETARRRFFAEGRLLAQLDHPRLVRVYDLGEDADTGRPYFVMDLVLGPEGRPITLADADGLGSDEDQVAIWYEDLRDGLSYIHERGILHRDLKLQNVLVGPDGHAVLSDFGVAKIFDEDLREKLGISMEQTLVAVKDGRKTVMGSVGYMAPEIELGVAASKESDWYALGVIVFRLLTGVWCDARTDVMGDLETYNPVWREILPKLLHSNPAGRECPSWRELEKARREEDAYSADKLLEELRAKRHDAVRGRRNGWVAATIAALVAATLACFVQRIAIPERILFEDIVRIPADAPESDDSPDDGSMPSRGRFLLALIDSWVLTHDLFADLRENTITREKVVSELRGMHRMAKDDSFLLFDSNRIGCDYSQQGDSDALAYLLQSAVSNLSVKAKKE